MLISPKIIDLSERLAVDAKPNIGRQSRVEYLFIKQPWKISLSHANLTDCDSMYAISEDANGVLLEKLSQVEILKRFNLLPHVMELSVFFSN